MSFYKLLSSGITLYNFNKYFWECFPSGNFFDTKVDGIRFIFHQALTKMLDAEKPKFHKETLRQRRNKRKSHAPINIYLFTLSASRLHWKMSAFFFVSCFTTFISIQFTEVWEAFFSPDSSKSKRKTTTRRQQAEGEIPLLWRGCCDAMRLRPHRMDLEVETATTAVTRL